jgi:hypothetical protein
VEDGDKGVEPVLATSDQHVTGTVTDWSQVTTTVTVVVANKFAAGDIVNIAGRTQTGGSAVADGLFTVATADTAGFTHSPP